MDEDLTDSSGYGNHGSCTNCPTPAMDVNGNAGSAYWFDGVNDIIDCGNDNSLNPNYVTVAMWLRPESFQDNAGLISKGDNMNRQYWAWIYNTNLDIEIGEGGYYNNVYDLDLDTWYHLAITFDGSEIVTYINGSEVRTIQQATGQILPDNDPLLIGTISGFQNFNGIIDDVRVYGRALSPQEISGIFSGGSCHRADTIIQDCCITQAEIIFFIGDWKQGLGGITMAELMQGIGLYNSGQGCP
jgi:hypothetical protein